MHVIIADSDAIGRRLIRKVVDNLPDHDVIGEGESLGQATDSVRQRRPDVLVLSSTLLAEGPQTVGELIDRTEAALVVVAVGGSGSSVWHGMSGGASGYVLRDRLPNDLPQALGAAEAGNAFVSAPLARQMIGYLADCFDNGYDGPSRSDVIRALLPRERETLQRLAGGESTGEIAEAMSVTTATVRAYVSRILRKLRVRSRGEAVVVAYRSRFYSPRRPQREASPPASRDHGTARALQR
ncbi:response regulator transcription factor [Micromonospora sp. NPDC048835]|uniref:response regulator transcription factor n=1 Tax=Micromonospora sp. NPDC048835 TaxID=3155147 RepID=UPI0033D0D5ED